MSGVNSLKSSRITKGGFYGFLLLFFLTTVTYFPGEMIFIKIWSGLVVVSVAITLVSLRSSLVKRDGVKYQLGVKAIAIIGFLISTLFVLLPNEYLAEKELSFLVSASIDSVSIVEPNGSGDEVDISGESLVSLKNKITKATLFYPGHEYSSAEYRVIFHINGKEKVYDAYEPQDGKGDIRLAFNYWVYTSYISIPGMLMELKN